MKITKFISKKTTIEQNPQSVCKFDESKINCALCNSLNNIGYNWKPLIYSEYEKSYYDTLRKTLHTDVFYPSPKNIFAFTQYFNIENTKVVIVGQDPYHNVNQATGLAFSVHKTMKIPPSLKNIFRELQNDIPEFKMPSHGNLTYWASQGVLLLNDVLTVKPNTPRSHNNIGWEKLTHFLLKNINDNCNNVVFILWGNHAKLKSKFIDSNRHLILTAAHPSPFSAKNFFKCQHFSKANSYLIKNGKEPIDWHII